MTMFRWIAGGSIFVALLPLMGLLLALAVAGTLGCSLDEGSPHSCPTAFGDIGETLYTLQVGGWFMLLTAPYAVGMGIAWMVVEIVRASRGKGRNDRQIKG